ncbi:Uridine-cytidine kinase C [Bienertia sinuspersici]
MDDEVVQRVFQEGGRDYIQQPSTSYSSILQSLPLHVSFDHGCYLLIKSIQELREKRKGIVTVGIGGPSGSGKTREGDFCYWMYCYLDGELQEGSRGSE